MILQLATVHHVLSHPYLLIYPAEISWTIILITLLYWSYTCQLLYPLLILLWQNPNLGSKRGPERLTQLCWIVSFIFIIMIIELTLLQHSGFNHFSTLLENDFLLSVLLSNLQTHLLFHDKGNRKGISTDSSQPA